MVAMNRIPRARAPRFDSLHRHEKPGDV